MKRRTCKHPATVFVFLVGIVVFGQAHVEGGGI
jgi:hypothetical protein